MDCPKCGSETIVSAQYFGSGEIIVEIVCWDEDCEFKAEKTIDVEDICQA